MLYLYDMKAGWKHRVVLEAKLPRAVLGPNSGQLLPACVSGENACPPEDVGGLSGYAKFLLIACDRSHEQHRDMMVWAAKQVGETNLGSLGVLAMKSEVHGVWKDSGFSPLLVTEAIQRLYTQILEQDPELLQTTKEEEEQQEDDQEEEELLDMTNELSGAGAEEPDMDEQRLMHEITQLAAQDLSDNHHDDDDGSESSWESAGYA
eukprot:TRINITY_DN8727_c0_g1_i2.p1 TRINITY_DN8727_c0_g1~~TRINITY_DN8727_c0_g1_i2.p1  ORF type:complete len:206 (+),score=67.13 TRINITY_DN8727_c0_g1_i2:422-1039(+)